MWLIYSTIPLPIFIGLGAAFRWFGRTSPKHVPAMSLIILAVAGLGLIQSIRFFESGNWEPSSVKIQRFMLEESTSIDESLFSAESKKAIALAKTVSDEKDAVQKSKLAVSVSPETSRAAVGSVAVAAILCWSSFIAFQRTSSHLWLFLGLVTMGIVMSCIGLYQAIGQSIPLMEQIRAGIPYGTFVSRNSAGGFLNVCLAGMVGLICVAFSTTTRRKSDHRYQVQDNSWIASTIGKFEDRLALIDSKQVASLVVLALIVSAVFASASRGATISMIAAAIATIFVSTRFSKTKASWIIGILVAALAVALLVTLEVDTRIRDRFGVVLEDGVARSYIWEVALRSMRYYLSTGSGLGTFHFAALPFQQTYTGGWFYHAENLIAEFFVEAGFVGMLVFLIGLAVVFRQITVLQRQGKRKAHLPILLATTFLTISCVIHNSVDFPLLVPAVFAPTFILIGALSGSCVLDRSASEGQFRAKRLNPSSSKREVDETDQVVKSPSETIEPDNLAKGTRNFASTPKLPGIIFFYSALCFSLFFLVSSLGLMRELARAESIERILAFDTRNLQILAESNDNAASESKQYRNRWNGSANTAESMRIQAEAEIEDFRKVLLTKLSSSNNVDWKATEPTLFRLAATRLANEKKIAELTELAGGVAAIEHLDNARTIYANARQLSPLDWRLILGESLVGWRASKSDQLRTIATLGVVSANKPSLLFRMGLIANELGEQSFSNNLWKIAMEADPSLATKIAGLYASTKNDGEIDVTIFPSNLSLLESVATSVFSQNRFPITNELLWKRIVNEAEKFPREDTNRWVWLAKSAKVANNEESEFEYLEKAVQGQPFNRSLRQRFAVLLANRGDFERSLNEITSCLQSNPQDPILQKLQKQVQQLSESSQSNR